MKPTLTKGKQKLPRPIRVTQTKLGHIEASRHYIRVVIPIEVSHAPVPGMTEVPFIAEIHVPFYDRTEKLEDGIKPEDAIQDAKEAAEEFLNYFDKGVSGFKRWSTR
jgi:hypothetical protein